MIRSRILPLITICLLSCISMDIMADPPQFRVLMTTKTDGWHHESIAEAVPAIRRLALKHQFELVWEENLDRVFTEENLRATYGGKLALLDQVGHRMQLSELGE